jgi:hypothetical protein
VRRLNFGGSWDDKEEAAAEIGRVACSKRGRSRCSGDRCRTDALSMLVNSQGGWRRRADGRGRSAARARQRNAQVSDWFLP